MKTRMLLGRFLMTALIAGAGVAGASDRDKIPAAPKSDADLVKAIQHEVRMYPHYTIWDDLSFRVNGGHVELLGAVSQPYKKQDIERVIERVPGVASVTDEIKVLPLSRMDDQLRMQVARAIFRDPVFSRYAMQAIPPIHIIVDSGHVTLTGVVSTDMEKQIAGMRASGAGLSFGLVTNNLQVEHPAKKS